MAPKGTNHVFSTFSVFGGSRYERLQYFLRFGHHLPEGSQIWAIPGIIPPTSYFNNNFMSPKTTKYTNIDIKEVQNFVNICKNNLTQIYDSCKNDKRGGMEVLLEINV